MSHNPPDSENQENSEQDSGDLQPSVELSSVLSGVSLGDLQRDDDELKPLIDKLEAGGESSDFVIEEGLLWHISAPVHFDPEQRMQLVIPKKLRVSLLQELHTTELGGGHVGVERTHDKVRRRYYWTNT